MWEKVARSAG